MSQELSTTDLASSPNREVILASASSARADLLRRTGICFTQCPAMVDEAPVKSTGRAQGKTAREVAVDLALAKASTVADTQPDALVIGADQMLACEGRWLDKPGNLDEARASLALLRGQAHELHSAICLVRDNHLVWQHVATARLIMRPFSDHFLDWYLAEMGDQAFESVGVYRLEGIGLQLFSEVKGDYFTILGLPLLPLLSALRQHGALAI